MFVDVLYIVVLMVETRVKAALQEKSLITHSKIMHYTSTEPSYKLVCCITGPLALDFLLSGVSDIQDLTTEGMLFSPRTC